MEPRKRVRLARRREDRVYQDDWGLVAQIYDLEHPACRGAEQAFWRAEAAAAGGEVLELAAGSGRVAIALAHGGAHVTGLELSEGMLARARQRAARRPPAVRERLEWVQADMASFDLPGRQFGLVFVAFNSFWLLTEAAAQRACLASVARHLAPSGRLVLDLFPPNQDDYHDEDGITQYLSSHRHGEQLLRVKDYHFEPARRLAISDVRYYGLGPDSERCARLVAQFRYCLRLDEPEDVRSLLEQMGYEVVETYGTYDRQPLEPNSPRAIFVAQRRTS